MRRQPKEVVFLFRKILKEASEFYQKAEHAVTSFEYDMIQNGRLGMHTISRLGGFTKLKAYVAPSKKSELTTESRKMLERILGK